MSAGKTKSRSRSTRTTTSRPAQADDLRRAARHDEQVRRQAEEAARVASLPVQHPHAAGIDVGDTGYWVCVEAAPDGADPCARSPPTPLACTS